MLDQSFRDVNIWNGMKCQLKPNASLALPCPLKPGFSGFFFSGFQLAIPPSTAV
jgi:hypothetical protein